MASLVQSRDIEAHSADVSPAVFEPESVVCCVTEKVVLLSIALE